MSNFKIIGESNPEVGKKITYSIANDPLNILPGQTSASANNPFVQTVHWSVYQLKRGQWVHKPNNDKTGNKVEYGFIEQTIEYDGLRIIAKRGEETAKLDIKTKRAKEGKILHIDLLDHEGNKPKKPFAYGQKVKAIVHCVNLDYCRGSATLWEDDELGRTGHNNANKKNNAVTLPFRVMDGKAEIDFLLHPDFNKMANTKPDAKNDKVEKEEGKTHEYYVTAQIFNQETKSSNTVEVNNLDVPIAPYKEKTTVQQKNTPNTPAATTKKGVSRVFFTNTANQPITSVFKETQIKVWIISSGITGRTIRLKLFDEDGLSDDELFAENFKIDFDTHAIVVPLNKIPRSKGGNYFGEGAEQEMYADIEVLQTHQHTKSAIVDVNASVFQPDPFVAINKKAMTGGEDKKENKKKGECYCYLQGIVKTACNGKGNSVTDEHFENLAKDIGVEAKVFKAVSIVESGGRKSFINVNGIQKAKILYERHYMYRFLKSIKTQVELNELKKDSPDIVHNIGTFEDPDAKYGTEKEQFDKLAEAKKINNDSAIKSCSWGKFQVMGKYFDYLYGSPNEMEEAMNMCEVQHFAYFKVYLKDVTGEPMIEAMKNKNWNKIAELYNGPKYYKNDYHTKMKDEYDKL